MGKKSKRKSNNKLPPCYHGCLTKKNFQSGEHYKILERWDNKADTVDDYEFYEQNKRVLDDPTFSSFVIAHVTDDFLKGKNNDLLLLRLWLLVDMRYVYIPQCEGKDVGKESENDRNHKKYLRDIATERGRINCIAREIPCDCMEEKRIAAKSMDKVASCYWCHKEVPKEKIRRCKGCDHAQYCSKDCSKKDWPLHGEWCKQNSVSSASAPTPGSLPSSFGELSDVDVDAKINRINKKKLDLESEMEELQKEIQRLNNVDAEEK